MVTRYRYIATTLFAVLLAVAFAIGGDTRPGGTVDAAPKPQRATHIVMFEDWADRESLLSELKSQYGVQVQHVYKHAISGASLVVPDGAVAALSAHSGVKLVEPNGGVEFLQALEFPDGQENQVQTWHQRSGVDASHPFLDIDGTGPNVDVDIAIIDSGVDGTHTDINLFRAVDCVFDGAIDQCVDIDDLSTSVDQVGHGTRVAGIAAARDNEFGIAGVAPGARIWSAKLTADDVSNGGRNPSPGAHLQAFIAAIDWISEPENAAQIDVVNMSIRLFDQSLAARTAIANSVNLGIVYFTSAGNSLVDVYGDDGVLGGGDDFEPASFPEVATISGYADLDGVAGGLGGTGQFGVDDDQFWIVDDPPLDPQNPPQPLDPWGSNFSSGVVIGNPVTSPGAAIDFAMPSYMVMSTCVDVAGGEFGDVATECTNTTDSFGNHYGRASGTSFASPQAAGLAALYIAINGVKPQNVTDVNNLRQALIDMAVAQDNPDYGLVANPNDPDSNPEPLGSARMALNFGGGGQIGLPSIGATQSVSVSTPYLPTGPGGVDSVQLNILYNTAAFTIDNVACGTIFTGGTPSAPNANGTGDGSIIGCSSPGGAFANTGSLLTFDIERTALGTTDFTLATSMDDAQTSGLFQGTEQVPNGALGSAQAFWATVTGSFSMQAVVTEGQRTAVGPTVVATPLAGGSSVAGTYDPATGSFAIQVIAPGDYQVRVDAAGFLSRLYGSLTVGDGTPSVLVPGTPDLNGGDVDGNGIIDIGPDVSTWLDSFTATTPDRTDGSGNIVDLNGDEDVSGLDLSILISNVGLAPTNGIEDWGDP